MTEHAPDHTIRAAGGVGSGFGMTDNVYQALLANRIVFLGDEVKDENANAICAQLLLLNAEDPEKDIYLYSRIMMHQPSGGIGGTASDIRIQAEQSLHVKREMATLIAQHTGQPLDQIEADSDRDRWFTAQQALEYGFIDHVYERASQITTDAPNQ